MIGEGTFVSDRNEVLHRVMEGRYYHPEMARDTRDMPIGNKITSDVAGDIADMVAKAVEKVLVKHKSDADSDEADDGKIGW